MSLNICNHKGRNSVIIRRPQIPKPYEYSHKKGKKEEKPHAPSASPFFPFPPSLSTQVLLPHTKAPSEEGERDAVLLMLLVFSPLSSNRFFPSTPTEHSSIQALPPPRPSLRLGMRFLLRRREEKKIEWAEGEEGSGQSFVADARVIFFHPFLSAYCCYCGIVRKIHFVSEELLKKEEENTLRKKGWKVCLPHSGRGEKSLLLYGTVCKNTVRENLKTSRASVSSSSSRKGKARVEKGQMCEEREEMEREGEGGGRKGSSKASDKWLVINCPVRHAVSTVSKSEGRRRRKGLKEMVERRRRRRRRTRGHPQKSWVQSQRSLRGNLFRSSNNPPTRLVKAVKSLVSVFECSGYFSSSYISPLFFSLRQSIRQSYLPKRARTYNIRRPNPILILRVQQPAFISVACRPHPPIPNSFSSSPRNFYLHVPTIYSTY